MADGFAVGAGRGFQVADGGRLRQGRSREIDSSEFLTDGFRVLGLSV